MKTIDYKKYDGHTPGPWGSVQHNAMGMRHAISGPNQFICKVPEPGLQSCCAESDGNAALIADAPMLLEACRERDAVLETLEISYRARIRELEAKLQKHEQAETIRHNAAFKPCRQCNTPTRYKSHRTGEPMCGWCLGG